MVTRLEKFPQGDERFDTLGDIDEVVRKLASLLKKTVKNQWVLVYFFDRDRRDFTPARGYGIPRQFLEMFKNTPLLPDKLPGLKTLLRRKMHMVISDAGTSPLLNPGYRRLLRNLTLLAVPMVVKGAVTGAVFVARKRSHPPFSPEEISLIKDMVSHAALVVSHSRLFDDTLDMAVDLARRIDIISALDGINKAISSSLSRKRIIATALEGIQRLISCRLIVVFQEEEGILTITDSRRTGDLTPDIFHQGACPVVTHSAVGDAFSSGKTVVCADLVRKQAASPLNRTLLKAGMNAILAIPLSIKETVRGVLLLADHSATRFTTEDIFSVEKVAAQIAVALENARLYEDMHTLYINIVTSLTNAIDAKSPWTKGHSERVMNIAICIAREMGLAEDVIERVRIGALLHDLGKIGIIETLLERPGKLNADELSPLRLHPEKGVAILAPIRQLQEILPAILHHHERFDGTGYPAGLKGEDIPLEARIIAVADAFDAMTADRPYRKGLLPLHAVKDLEKNAGSQFDPMVIKHFRSHCHKTFSNLGKRDTDSTGQP